MNLQQFLKRFDAMVKPETELMRQQRELGLLVISEFKKDVDMLEAVSFCMVLKDCKERDEKGEPIPDDLTDELFAARAKAEEAFNSKSIPIVTLDPA